MNRARNLRQRYREIYIESHQRRVDRLNRTLPGWRNRKRRRPLVIACAITVLVGAVVALGTSAEPSVGYLIWLGFVVIWFWQWILLRLVTSGISESSTLVLDERETALRDRATRYGFITAMTLNGALVGGLGAHGFEQVTAAQLSLVIASATLICGTVPVGFLAWTLPDDDPEDMLDDVEAAPDAEADAANSAAHARPRSRSPEVDAAARPTTGIPSTEGTPAAETDGDGETGNEWNGGGRQ